MALSFNFNPFTGNFDQISTVTINATANGLSIDSNQVLSLALSSTSMTGALSSTDWNTFNGKQASGNYITALTGDVTATGPGSVAATLATVNSNTGSFGSSTSIPSFTVNGKGLITAASGNVVIAPAGTLSGTTLNSTVVSSSLTSVGTITSGTWNGTTIAIANGGTGQTSLITTPTASTIPAWDANKNLSANNLIEGYATTATAAGTTTLTVASPYQQYFTGTSTQTVVLPVTSTLVLGQQFQIINNSTGTVTVESSGANVIQAMAANTQLTVTVISTSLTTAAAWNAVYVSGIAAVINPTQQKFLSGSGTYTTPAGVQYIRVQMAGGGGGGAGSGTAAGSAATSGGNSTFGTSLLTANGGAFAPFGGISTSGGVGGTATLNSPAFGTATKGGQGGGGGFSTSSSAPGNGMGGANAFGGGGASGGSVNNTGGDSTGKDAVANTGGGGGGAGEYSAINSYGGGGGGAGGYIDAIIPSPSSTYSYAIGAGGNSGGAGTNGSAGGNGTAGIIIVTEYYTNYQVSTTTSVAAGTFLAGPTSGSNGNPTFRALQAPTIQKFTSGSGTYTTPAGALYIKVQMVGGGGGGQGSGSGGGFSGLSGSNTTFGTNTAGLGSGAPGNGAGGAGGTNTFSLGFGTSIAGGSGGGTGAQSATNIAVEGSMGGGSAFGGAGGGGSGYSTTSGQAAATNSGSGGGGGGGANASGAYSGAGGGAGGYLDFIVTSPSSTYSYAVGTGGAGGAGASGGASGGAGGSGLIIVTEYYQ